MPADGDAVTPAPLTADGPGDPVFLLCAGRSGSTLVRFLLDAHPELACPPEAKLPWLCAQLAKAWGVLLDERPPEDEDAHPVTDAVAAGLRRTVQPMMDACLERRGKRRYCDKSLGAAWQARLLLQVWPGARFISLYRHPMDVIGSGLEASPWGLTSYGFDRYVISPPDNNVAALARYWYDHTAAIMAAEDRLAGRCLRLRYEDLVVAPEPEAARLFEFLGAAPAPGITDWCFRSGHQRFGPGDYKIWDTAGVTAGSVGRGWAVPARLIPAPLKDMINELAGSLGYLPVEPGWGTGARPADLRADADGAQPAAESPFPPEWARALDHRVRAGMARRGEASLPGAETVLLFATCPAAGRPDAWWRLDLAAGTADSGRGAAPAAADWSITGSAQAWDRLLAGHLDLAVAFRRGDLRYADQAGGGAGTPRADRRVAGLATRLGIITRPPPGLGD